MFSAVIDAEWNKTDLPIYRQTRLEKNFSCLRYVVSPQSGASVIQMFGRDHVFYIIISCD